ncbi:hypothetical protein LUZ61_012530 [Rhynchospora tenuis]|uniref:RRM domain-containing protein n=1 Tax=Rhynchospora tenuis TaxID=198213 RepID=A0AAD6A3B6_9POAL|nr:hypothetical protein LUZ61_012530 [Rhynchospora tenuis]
MKGNNPTASMYGGAREAMAGPGGRGSDGGFSDGSGGYSEGGSKRPPRMIESNPYFAVSGVRAPGLLDAYDGTPGGSKMSRTFDPSPYFMGPTFYPPFPGGGLPGGGLPGGGSTAGLYNFPVVRIRGLPFNCEDVDIYKFFSGLDVVDCLFVNKNGRFTGDAYVVFPTPMQAQLALQRDRQNMGHRYVEVFACKKSDYYNAIAAEVNFGVFGYPPERSPPPARHKRPREEPREDEAKNLDEMHFTEILKLRGLPYSVTRAEIVEFFGEEFHLKESDVHICCRFDGKATGEAFAEFPSADIAKQAMSRDKMTIGSRYVELFPSTPEEASRAKSRSRQ